jgi:hypothetical protein
MAKNNYLLWKNKTEVFKAALGNWIGLYKIYDQIIENINFRIELNGVSYGCPLEFLENSFYIISSLKDNFSTDFGDK